VIVDSSALVAILREEVEARAFLTVMALTQRLSVGSPTVLQISMVLGSHRTGHLHDFLRRQGVTITAFGANHLSAAQRAFGLYGKGTGSPAKLNFGDCMSYALAKVSGEPLLFKGDDFTHTDVTPAWVPEG
jgi:ribonuclease VapC